MAIIKFSHWAVKLALWSIPACMGLVVPSAYLMARFEQTRADNLISLLSKVTPGMTSQVSIEEELRGVPFLKRIPNVCENDSLQGCDQFGFSNWWLAFLHLAPAKRVWVTLEYRRGVVISKSAQLAEEPHLTAVTRQLLRETAPLTVQTAPSSRTITLSTADPKNAIAKVYDDENVTSNQRQKDWMVDLSCLSRMGSCGDPRAILYGAFPKE